MMTMILRSPTLRRLEALPATAEKQSSASSRKHQTTFVGASAGLPIGVEVELVA
jgi:hypothetical protein